jgi:hypothetical protein
VEDLQMSRILRFVVTALVLAVATPVMAQVQTGSILVRAADEQGAVMPGVTITITSPVLVAGSMTAVTDAGGVNRFPSLVPGTYTVKLELQGFQTIVREGIVVLVGHNARRSVAEGGERSGNNHRDWRLTHRRYHERERARQPE